MSAKTLPEEIRSQAAVAAEALYRLSEFVNFDAALKFGLRKSAMEIISGMAGLTFSSDTRRNEHITELLADIAGIQELIRFAAARFYITPENAERVLRAYRSMGEMVQELAGAGNPESVPLFPLDAGIDKEDLNERQRRIMEFLASNGRVQIGDIRQIFGETASEKTLQRDLWQLANSGLIRRQGDNRWTTYSLGH